MPKTLPYAHGSVTNSTQCLQQGSRLPQQRQPGLLDTALGFIETNPFFLLIQASVIHLLLRGAPFSKLSQQHGNLLSSIIEIQPGNVLSGLGLLQVLVALLRVEFDAIAGLVHLRSQLQNVRLGLVRQPLGSRPGQQRNRNRDAELSVVALNMGEKSLIVT